MKVEAIIAIETNKVVDLLISAFSSINLPFSSYYNLASSQSARQFPKLI